MIKKMEVQFDSRIKFQVYDLQERKLLKTSELKAIMNEIMSLKNNEVEFLSNERYCISSFLNFQDKKCNDLFEGDIVLCQFKDKFTKKNKEKEVVILIYEKNNLLPMVELIENSMFNFKYYIDEDELEILKIGNIIKNKELLDDLKKMNELYEKTITEKYTDKSKVKEIKKEIKKFKSELFKKYNFQKAGYYGKIY